MERLERLKDNNVELTEEQKEFDAYDDEMNELFGKPNKEEEVHEKHYVPENKKSYDM